MASKIIFACWIAFFVYWLFASVRVKAVAERQSAGSRLFHSVYLWIGALLLLRDMPFLGLDHRWLAYTPRLGAAAAFITAAGVALAIWARTTLGGNWSGAVTIKQGHELVQRGPYRWVRNPIYTGLLLMFAGTALAIGEMRGLAAVALVYLGFWIKIRQEEAFMLRQFPDAFPAYRDRVRALIPFVL